MNEFTERTLKKINGIIQGLADGKYSFIAGACETEGLSRTIFYKWRKASAANKTLLNEALDNHRVVEAEDSLFEQIKKGNMTAIIFFLCNRMPSRWKRNDSQHATLEEIKQIPMVINVEGEPLNVDSLDKINIRSNCYEKKDNTS